MDPATRPYAALTRSRSMFTPEQARRAQALVAEMEVMANSLAAITPGFLKEKLPPLPAALSGAGVASSLPSHGGGGERRVASPSPARRGLRGMVGLAPSPFNLELNNQFGNLVDDCAGSPRNIASPAVDLEAILPLHRPRGRQPRGKKAPKGTNDTTTRRNNSKSKKAVPLGRNPSPAEEPRPSATQTSASASPTVGSADLTAGETDGGTANTEETPGPSATPDEQREGHQEREQEQCARDADPKGRADDEQLARSRASNGESANLENNEAPFQEVVSKSTKRRQRRAVKLAESKAARAQRQPSIPVVLAATNARQLEEMNPRDLCTSVTQVAGVRPLAHFFNKKGDLVVRVGTRDAAARLLKCDSINETGVRASIVGPHMESSGLIKGVPLRFTDERLVGLLSDQGVVHTRRLFSNSGESGATASSRVVVTFSTTRPRPKVLDLGFTKHRVFDYVEPPRRCFKCQRFGHVSSRCQDRARCSHCSGLHDVRDCDVVSSPPKCINCKAAHKASYLRCPARLEVISSKRQLLGKLPPLSRTPPTLPTPVLDAAAFPALPARANVVASTSSPAGGSPAPADVTPKRVTSSTQTSSPGKPPEESARHSTVAAGPPSPISEGPSTLFAILSALVEGLQDGQLKAVMGALLPLIKVALVSNAPRATGNQTHDE